MTPRRTFGLALSLLALGCAGPADDAPGFEPGVERAAIVNGELSDETDDEVVDIYAKISDTSTLHCSGTLIAPDVVLTALHCVAYRADPNAPFTCNADGSIKRTIPEAGSLGAPVPGENVQVFVGATHDMEPDALGVKVFGTGASQICRGDLAAVVLDREIGQKVAPLRFGRRVTIGETMKIVGYGQTEEASSQARHRRSGLSVLDVGVTACGPGSSTTPPETFVLSEGACHGDSGGPAFSEETGAITGVYSLSLAPSCLSIGVRNTFTVVPSFEGVIREALDFAGREPLLEPNTGGSAGAPGCAASGGSSASGGSDPIGEGSGSREDACACRTAGTRPSAPYAWFGLALVMSAYVRRRARTRD